MDNAKTILLNGETAERIIVTNDGQHPDHWLITLDYGWAQTIVATCDYPAHARGIAVALAEALDCGHVEWPVELEGAVRP